MAHIQGAATLMALRGNKQLDSELGRKLFHHASMNIRTNCSMQCIPVPAEFSRLQERAATVLDQTSPAFRLGHLMDGFLNMRLNLEGKLTTEVVRVARYLDKLALDQMADAETRMPYKVISQETRPVKVYTYKSTFHKYPSQSAARYWNVIRMFRLFINEYLFYAAENKLRCVIANRPEPNDPLYEEWDRIPAKAAIEAEAAMEEMLASVPYSLELLENPPQSAARFLIWPLCCVGASDLCQMSARKFALDRLKALGELHELEQATQAATMLEEGIPTEDWLHLLHFS